MKESIKIIPDEKAIAKIKQMMNDGYTDSCVVCGSTYKSRPERYYDNISCSGGSIPECNCGSDLFQTLDEILERVPKTITVDEPRMIFMVPTLVFKEYNFKHCCCTDDNDIKHEIHCGSAEWECGNKCYDSDAKIINKNQAHITCQLENREDYRIIILRATKEEREEHKDEYMSNLDYLWESEEDDLDNWNDDDDYYYRAIDLN